MKNGDNLLIMNIYLLSVLGFAVFLIMYYFYIKYKRKQNENLVLEFGVSCQQQLEYIDAADKSKKINSPITNEPFQMLSVSGTELVNKEAFCVNDCIVEGSEYRVL